MVSSSAQARDAGNVERLLTLKLLPKFGSPCSKNLNSIAFDRPFLGPTKALTEKLFGVNSTLRTELTPDLSLQLMVKSATFFAFLVVKAQVKYSEGGKRAGGRQKSRTTEPSHNSLTAHLLHP